MDLALAKNLRVPLDAVTQTFGFMGKKGSGKTYLAGLMAEQMLDRHAQIVVIDPVGNWYGLRVGADGNSKGKDIFIVGGEHGDVPILPDAGARLARLLVEKQISVILDISSFRQGERKRFAADFAEEFYHLKKTQKSAVHLFVEEAQLFAPQRPGPDDMRMLGAFESIIRLGRNYGIGASMISQRPQSVNKEVLSQVECLFVLQVNGTHERKALEEWVQEVGADRSLVGQLPGLTQGEGYVWSPSWLRVFARFNFGKKTTFDASATPTVGQKRQAATLTKIDVAALKADMQQVIEKAEADDPAALRRQIADLKRQLAAKLPAGKIETLDRGKLIEAQKAELTKILENNFKRIQDQFLKHIRESLARVQDAEHTIIRVHDSILAASWSIDLTSQAKHVIQAATVTTSLAEKPLPRNNAITTAPRPTAESNGKMGKGERAVLTVLAQHGTKNKNFVAAVAGYSVTAGGFGNILSGLRTQGYIAGSNPIEITQEGLAALGAWNPMPSGIELLEFWKRKLGKAERLILGALAESNHAMTKAELAEATGYEASGGGFGNSLSSLRTLELIEGSGSIQLNRDFAEALNQ
ncbi:MAG TPA: DUF87 domain-containing protein [Terracidiphilus sp.]|jgi:hypothetical protein|nr:DUF87 domain-containing protein [Terracidiphilus sp.]